jgi:hypothetical protein
MPNSFASTKCATKLAAAESERSGTVKCPFWKMGFYFSVSN